jgi:hypothetical protein
MSVQFDGTQMTFDFIQLDLYENESIDPEFLTKIEYETYETTDASAISSLSVNKLNGIFWFKILERDLNDNNDTLFSMMTENWPQFHYSDSIVTAETAISHTNVTISEDFVRSIIRDIMGTRGLNCLFSNLEEMKQDVVNLDSLFDTLIRNKINTIGGTFNNPKHLSDISPVGHLWNALINQENALDERRIWFINKVNEQRLAYEKMYENVAFYYYGNDGIHGEGYYYPLYLSPRIGSQKIQFKSDQEFYIIGSKKGVPFLDLNATDGLFDYHQYSNPYFPMEFLKDDILKIRLTYHHTENAIYNKTINPRSYMLYLKLV